MVLTFGESICDVVAGIPLDSYVVVNLGSFPLIS